MAFTAVDLFPVPKPPIFSPYTHLLTGAGQRAKTSPPPPSTTSPSPPPPSTTSPSPSPPPPPPPPHTLSTDAQSTLQCRLKGIMTGKLSKRLLHICLNFLFRAHSLEKAEAVLVDAVRVGYRPTPATYNRFIIAYCRFAGVDQAYATLCRMREAGLKPDAVSYNSLIAGASWHSLPARSRYFFEEMLQAGIRPDVWTYNTLLNCLFKHGYSYTACEVYSDMIHRGISPCLVTYNTLINGMCKAGEVSTALVLFQSLVKTGFRADIVTYNTIFDGLCKCGWLGEAQKILNELGDSGYVPNAVTYTTLMKCYFTSYRYEDGLRVFYDMQHKGLLLDTFVYCTVISALVKFGRFSEARAYKEILENCGVLDTACYNTIAYLSFKEGDVGDAQKWLLQIGESGLQSDIYTHCIFVELLCKSGREAAALSYIHNLQTRGPHSKLVAYNSVIHRLCNVKMVDTAVKVFDEMVVRDCFTYTSLLHGLCVAQWFGIAFKIIMMCLKEGLYVPSSIKRAVFIGLRTSGFKSEVKVLRKTIRKIRRSQIKLGQ